MFPSQEGGLKQEFQKQSVFDQNSWQVCLKKAFHSLKHLIYSAQILKQEKMLKDILSITGHSGLFKVISRGSKSLIVESLTTGKRMPAHSTSKIISLEDIAIYTYSGEVPFKDVIKMIAEKEGKQPSIDPKSDNSILKKYFSEVLPEYDEDRVYVSDIKKVILWYNILQEKEMLDFEEPEPATDETEEAE
jgi:hypothetical protein